MSGRHHVDPSIASDFLDSFFQLIRGTGGAGRTLDLSRSIHKIRIEVVIGASEQPTLAAVEVGQATANAVTLHANNGMLGRVYVASTHQIHPRQTGVRKDGIGRRGLHDPVDLDGLHATIFHQPSAGGQY